MPAQQKAKKQKAKKSKRHIKRRLKKQLNPHNHKTHSARSKRQSPILIVSRIIKTRDDEEYREEISQPVEIERKQHEKASIEGRGSRAIGAPIEAILAMRAYG